MLSEFTDLFPKHYSILCKELKGPSLHKMMSKMMTPLGNEKLSKKFSINLNNYIITSKVLIRMKLGNRIKNREQGFSPLT